MKGWEALKALEEGKFIRSKDFDDEVSYDHFYLRMVDNNVISVCIKDFKHFKKGDSDIEYVSISSLYECDWEIYEEDPEINKQMNKALSLFLLDLLNNWSKDDKAD